MLWKVLSWFINTCHTCNYTNILVWHFCDWALILNVSCYRYSCLSKCKIQMNARRLCPSSIRSIGESLFKPHHGVTEHAWLVVFLHLWERSLFHFVLEKIKQFNLKLRVKFWFLKDVKFCNDLIECVNLKSVGISSTN